MKVLQVNKYLYYRGGSETYMFRLADALKEVGIEIEYWGMENKRNIVEDTYNSFARYIDYKNISFINKIRSSFPTIYSIKNRKKIAKVLDAFKPDIVHIHNYNFQLTPSILFEIKKRNIKIVQTVHDSQMICPSHRLYNDHKQKNCIKCVKGSFINCIKDRCFNNSFLESSLGSLESIVYHTLDVYNKYIDKIVVPSNFLANLTKSRIEVNKIEVLPNFTNQSNNTPSKANLNFLFYGRVSSDKGVFELIDVFSDLEFNLTLIGEGPESNIIEEKCKKFQNIEFLGSRYGDELFKHVKNSKYVIQPSLRFENCPMTIIESFALGVPVIASNHSGFKELINNGKTGYLLDFNDHTEVKEQLKRIAILPIEPLQKNIAEFHEKFLAKEIHIAKIKNIYSELLQ